MLRGLRETGPALLVPLAWTFAAAAHVGAIPTRTVLVGHVVMDVLLAAFAALSWREMRADRALRPWLGVVLAGLGLTLAGTAALATGSGPALLRATVLGWMALPAAALADTGRLVEGGARLVYLGGGACSGLGALAFLVGWVAGADLALVAIALAGVGQTAGIVDAVLRY